jgi:phosphoribosylamine--glycine ligase
MRVLVIGGGGREHALCWKFRRDDAAVELHAAPGNPGIAEVASCHPVAAADLQGILGLAEAIRPELVVIGPEDPLSLGLADLLRDAGFATFGPSRAAARIESSKRFAKELMQKYQIPTARFASAATTGQAIEAAERFGFPVVVKASGLAAGKGVAICNSRSEAEQAVDTLFRVPGAELVIEEYMEGEELSVFAICDGTTGLLLLASQDHKRLLEGDQGPNTGGMGAYAPVSIATPALMRRISEQIVQPTLAALAHEGTPFMGLLYAGLMLSADGSPRVVEFNARFGDPETQVVLPLMRDPLLPLLVAASTPGGLAGAKPPEFEDRCAVTTIMASAGYPGTGSDPVTITLPARPGEGTTIFQAGTRMDGEKLVTAGGRVLAVTSSADTLLESVRRSQACADSIHFEGSQWRRDIAWRELQRTAQSAPVAR